MPRSARIATQQAPTGATATVRGTTTPVAPVGSKKEKNTHYLLSPSATVPYASAENKTTNAKIPANGIAGPVSEKPPPGTASKQGSTGME